MKNSTDTHASTIDHDPAIQALQSSGSFMHRACVIFLISTMHILVLFSAPCARGADVYSFESLTANAFVDGQDNWITQPGLGDAVIQLDASGNGTKVVRHFQTVVFDQTAFITRTNDIHFDFVQFSGLETNAIIQFEATGEHVAMFALGTDVNGDGMLTSAEGEIGPSFGAFDRNFRIQEANLGTAYDDGFNEGGGDGNSGNDWYRIQLRINFTSLGGDGTGTLYFMNLTDGDTSFHTVSGLRNQPLGLNRLHPEAVPGRWNALWLQLLTNGNSVPSADNLTPNVDGIRITQISLSAENVLLQWRGGMEPYQLQRRDSLGPATDWENLGGTTTQTNATTPITDNAGFFRVLHP